MCLDKPPSSFCSWQRLRPNPRRPVLTLPLGLSSRFFHMISPHKGEEQIKRGKGIQREKQNAKKKGKKTLMISCSEGVISGFNLNKKRALEFPGYYLTVEPKWVFSVKSEIVVQSEDRLIYTSPWQRLGKLAQRSEDGYYGIASFLLFFLSSLNTSLR